MTYQLEPENTGIANVCEGKINNCLAEEGIEEVIVFYILFGGLKVFHCFALPYLGIWWDPLVFGLFFCGFCFGGFDLRKVKLLVWTLDEGCCLYGTGFYASTDFLLFMVNGAMNDIMHKWISLNFLLDLMYLSVILPKLGWSSNFSCSTTICLNELRV